MSPPKRPTHPPSGREFAAALLRRTKQHAAVEKEVMAAVRSRGENASSDQRRTWLEDELQQRNITRDPIWIEQKLDNLESSGIQRTIRKADAIADLGKLASSMLRNRQQEAAVPDWMRPPANAQVDVCSPLLGHPPGTERSAVVLDTGTDSLLERVLKESPVHSSRLASGFLVWFDRIPTSEHQVSVNIGTHKIGEVASTIAREVHKAIETAIERGQRPRAHGILARADHLSPPYLLVITIPVSKSSPKETLA